MYRKFARTGDARHFAILRAFQQADHFGLADRHIGLNIYLTTIHRRWQLPDFPAVNAAVNFTVEIHRVNPQQDQEDDKQFDQQPEQTTLEAFLTALTAFFRLAWRGLAAHARLPLLFIIIVILNVIIHFFFIIIVIVIPTVTADRALLRRLAPGRFTFTANRLAIIARHQ